MAHAAVSAEPVRAPNAESRSACISPPAAATAAWSATSDVNRFMSSNGGGWLATSWVSSWLRGRRVLMRVSATALLLGRLDWSTELTNECTRAIRPCSGAIFGPQPRFSRLQIAGLEQQSLDFLQRIVVVRRVEIVDQVAN